MNYRSLVIIAFITLTACFQAVGAPRYRQWEKSDILLPDLEMRDLRFTNRSRCALDSKKPSETAFALVQNMEVARAFYRLAQDTGNNPSQLTKIGIKVFRYAVIKLLDHIHMKITKGELPLLPVDLNERGVPRNYKNISRRCTSDKYCNTELNACSNSTRLLSSMAIARVTLRK